MAELRTMPKIRLSKEDFLLWGNRWLATSNEETGKKKHADAFDRQQSVNFASFIDLSFGQSLAKFLGGIPVASPRGNSLIPEIPDSVEVGPVRIIGGVRPQNFDVAYRPDGPRVVFDSKTLNDTDSARKNWQNMVNDLGTEATTVHTRFPYTIVAFIVVIPAPALLDKQYTDIVRTLERLGTRRNIIDQPHFAESISLIVWDPRTGELSRDRPDQNSSLRVEKMPSVIQSIYLERYKGLPPHD